MISAYNERISELKDQYPLMKSIYPSVYAQKSVVFRVSNFINNNGFLGSDTTVVIDSPNITHECPACIAAPLVNMVARNKISLGMDGQGCLPVPVRFYVPEHLSITAKHLSVGEIKMLVEPKGVFISCQKLTLSKHTEEDPSHFEIVKSWVNDDAEIEIIQS